MSITLYLASQMWLLGRLLPYLVGQYVPRDDEHYRLFLQLLSITNIILSPALTMDRAALLSTLLADHHRQFRLVYPLNSVIPKMHYLVHIPRLTVKYINIIIVLYYTCTYFVTLLFFRFGPLRQLWTMRYESKHSYFKQLSNSIGNFKNICWTLAKRHSYLQSYYLQSFEALVDTINPGKCEMHCTCSSYKHSFQCMFSERVYTV